MPTLQNGEKKLKDLRESNIALVINLMRKFGICSRAELSKASGLVQSTITSIIDSLIKAGGGGGVPSVFALMRKN